MKVAYHEKWNQEDHITVFRKRLNNKKVDLADVNIVITDEDNMKLYTDQVYGITALNKEEITKCEKKTGAERTWENVTE